MRTILAPTLLGALLLGAGCGDLSNSDLVFLSAIPTKKELALETPRAPAQTTGALTTASALVGAPAELRGHVFQASSDLNGGVGQALDFVDGLGRGYPPTTRTDDARIWGPVSDVDGSGRTLRLEIRRNAATDEGLRFDFCLQIGLDSNFTGGAGSCAPGETAGLATIMWGHFQPRSAEGGARSGVGELHLDFDASRAVGVGKESDRGQLSIQYDFSRGGQAKTVSVEARVDEGLGSPPVLVHYAYDRDDSGLTSFFLEFPEDLVGGGWTNPTSLLRETMAIDSCWRDGGPGRADVLITEGDVEPGEFASATECWDAAGARTFYRLTVSQDPSRDVLEGTPTSCPDC